ncbi:ATP-grasp domain-containing protein [Nannocystis sp.]|uniref:ATP-grasp domain-containing protein n=1 Tax=Nannocystis sp. TaxID=1962667 RepID=UPI0024274469|nr:ATP-grasp domain-containing protein [Nannocystis sp.]MBK7830470.1 ATP-grasp domain-containing protein [Nannocystis sp.]MBK9757221.1 ATP-grasp domain-containing protein [Nannocystis sp.]
MQAALQRLGHTAILLGADDDLDLKLRAARVSACLIAAHGAVGASGELQGLLGLRGIPFAGPSAATVALAHDKLRSRQILGFHSLPVPATVALGGAEPPTRHALGLLGWPCVLKPRHGCHGQGVRHLADAAAVADAADEHRTGTWLLERAVTGREIQVVLLDGKVLGAMEVDRDPAGQICAMVCPPSLSRSRRHGIDNLATHAVAALGLTRGTARVDLLLHERHNEVILEVEPLPPLHRAGVVAKVAHAAGLRYEQLVAAIVHDLVDPVRPTKRRPTVPATPRLTAPTPTLSEAVLQ